MVKTDGTVLVENDHSSLATGIDEILGVTPDGRGIVALTYGNVVRYIGSDGASRDLAVVESGAGTVVGPYAAYAP